MMRPQGSGLDGVSPRSPCLQGPVLRVELERCSVWEQLSPYRNTFDAEDEGNPGQQPLAQTPFSLSRRRTNQSRHIRPSQSPKIFDVEGVNPAAPCLHGTLQVYRIVNPSAHPASLGARPRQIGVFLPGQRDQFHVRQKHPFYQPPYLARVEQWLKRCARQN